MWRGSMRKVEVVNIEKELVNLITNMSEEIIYCIHENPLVFKSKEGEINSTYCETCGIRICNSFNMGGIIVANKEDINMAIMKREGWNVGKDVLQYIKDRLSYKISNITINNNDILIDDKYKVISFASINANNRLIYTCLHFSFNPNIELIKNICIKDMVKIPRGLYDYGVSQEEILEIVSSFEKEKL